MKFKLLIISSFSNEVRDLYNMLGDSFNVRVCQLSKDGISHGALSMLKTANPDLVIVYPDENIDLSQFADEEIGETGEVTYNNFKSHPLAILGTAKEIASFEEAIDAHPVIELIMPSEPELIVNRIKAHFKIIEESMRKKAGAYKAKRDVLVVDDDIRMLKMMKMWLENTYNVTMINSGLEALRYLDKHKPDAIILDYEMPLFNGKQTFEKIRENEDTKDIPVFFFTGISDRKKIIDTLIMKPQGFILKSSSKDQVINDLETYFKELDTSFL